MEEKEEVGVAMHCLKRGKVKMQETKKKSRESLKELLNENQQPRDQR